MLYTKVQGNWLRGSGEDFKGFTIYGHGGHLGDVTWTNYLNFSFPILCGLHMIFGFNRSSGF